MNPTVRWMTMCFLARSSDEVYPKHLSLDERVAF